jgi:large subunit ribosomal protein L25
MEKVKIQATPRTVIGKQVRALRRAGQIPAVLYGRHMEPVMISMDAHTTSRTLAHMTASSLVTIELEGKDFPALVREKQRNFIKGNLLHVDFQVVSMTEKLRTSVGIEIVGLAPAVKDFNAILINGLDELEVECLPQDLPERIVVDISGLMKIGDGIHVRDIPVSDKVEILDEKDEMIILATAAHEEEEEVVVAEVVEEEPEVIERGKKEEGEEEEK